jgi:hypothetical protein
MWIGFLKTYLYDKATPETVQSFKFHDKKTATKWLNSSEKCNSDSPVTKFVKVLYDVPDHLVMPDEDIMQLKIPVPREQLYELFFSIHCTRRKYAILTSVDPTKTTS